MSSTPRTPKRPRSPQKWSAVETLLVWGAIALFSAACATSARDRARIAEQAENFDEAVVEYTRALQGRPGDRALQRDLERAKLRAAQYHYAQGRRQIGIGNYEEGLVEYQIASELNPESGEIQDALRDTRQAVQTRLVARRDGLTALEAVIERTRTLPPAGLELPEDVLPDSLIFRDASTRDVFSALGQFADITDIFDPAFADNRISVDLRGATLSNALTSLSRSTRNFYRVTAPQTVTVVPDTPAKRREYEEEVVQTFYLSNADIAETIDLLRLVVDLRRLAPVTATRAISIKDTPERLAAAARLIAAIDKASPEVVIDVELLEVDRQRLREYGLQFASAGSTGLNGFAGINESEGLSVADLGGLTNASVFVANLPGLFYRLLKRDQNTRTLANPHLRTTEGQTAQARFGEQVPVPVTTFTPFAAGGIQQQPITSFNYRDIGVNIDITPHTHHNDDVSLELTIEVLSISGVGFGDLPTFGNRSIETTIRLRDGETNILAGLIRDEEREVLEGIPGLSDLPLVGRLFARNRTETQETDIIVTLTPRIIRVLDLDEADLRAFRVARDTGTGLDIRAPLPSPLPPTTFQPTPLQPPVTSSTGATPITPAPPPNSPPQ
ncbi:MAG: type II and III secretion system protein [Acidobacteriota bacterium]|nr:type II and III secretion system protein [Acidobacteriota bacterium]